MKDLKENYLLKQIAEKMITRKMYHDSTIIADALSSNDINFKHKVLDKYFILLYA